MGNEYTAQDYIKLIEIGRRDKISPFALEVIAAEFRRMEKEISELKEFFNRMSE